MQRYNARLFGWDAARRTACVGISELGRPMNPHMLVRVFSPRTGDETLWAHTRNIVSLENEIMGWVLIPFSTTVDLFPHIAQWEMTIFND